jgi:hypothetical protein
MCWGISNLGIIHFGMNLYNQEHISMASTGEEKLCSSSAYAEEKIQCAGSSIPAVSDSQ